jgi:nickel transport protein
MMFRSTSIVLMLMVFGLMPVAAHEVHHSIGVGDAVVVQLKYADGKPFAFEAFEAAPDGSEIPAQVGRTDAEGRAVFIPGAVKSWKLKAYSADGHGVSLNFEAPALAASSASDASGIPNRISLLLFGLSLLLGGFGVYQLWLKKKP